MNRSYMVVWHYEANHGYDVIHAASREEALKKHPYFGSCIHNQMEFFVFLTEDALHIQKED